MTTPAPGPCPDGPLLALCHGARCAGLWRLAQQEPAPIRRAVAGTPGAVLVSAECLGPCHLGAVAVLARRDGTTGCSGPGLWLSGVEDPRRREALRRWITTGGPRQDPCTWQDVPGDLTEAVIGTGPPMGAPRPLP